MTIEEDIKNIEDEIKKHPTTRQHLSKSQIIWSLRFFAEGK